MILFTKGTELTIFGQLKILMMFSIILNLKPFQAFPVLVLLFVALWFILRGDLLYVFPSVILFLFFFFFSPFSMAITSLGEERANLSAFRTFVRFVLV